MTSLAHNNYTIAWIYTLLLDVIVACVMLDKTYSLLLKPSTDLNIYELGELNGHYIVIACLLVSVYGTVSAIAVVSYIYSAFC
jgi:hypothetical protein